MGQNWLSISMDWWHAYQGLWIQAIKPLTHEQLAYRVGEQRSAGEIAQHVISVRAWYLHGVMGEGGVEMDDLIGLDSEGAPARSAEELLIGIEQTWQLLSACITKWSVDDLQDPFFINWRNREESRGWVVWHMLEHEIHHGGELSFTLGTHGLAGVDV